MFCGMSVHFTQATAGQGKAKVGKKSDQAAMPMPTPKPDAERRKAQIQPRVDLVRIPKHRPVGLEDHRILGAAATLAGGNLP